MVIILICFKNNGKIECHFSEWVMKPEPFIYSRGEKKKAPKIELPVENNELLEYILFNMLLYENINSRIAVWK